MAIEIIRDYTASSDALWEIVGTPDRVDWVPGVERCEFDGEVRAMSMKGAGAIKERILSLDPEEKTIRYSCIESAAPLEKHLASITVSELDTGCRLTWRTTVEPVAFETFIVDNMNQSLDQIERLLSGNGGT